MNVPGFIIIMTVLVAVIIWCDVTKNKPVDTFIDEDDGKLVKVYLDGYDGLYVPTYRYEKEGEKPIYCRACKRG